jgi:hypothetical protein
MVGFIEILKVLKNITLICNHWFFLAVVIIGTQANDLH